MNIAPVADNVRRRVGRICKTHLHIAACFNISEAGVERVPVMALTFRALPECSVFPRIEAGYFYPQTQDQLVCRYLYGVF